MSTNILFALLIFVGCYNPDLTRVHYTCDEANPYCPDSLQCFQGCCGGPPCKAGPVFVPDGATVTDMGVVFPPDLRAPLTGCKGNQGHIINDTMNACLGMANGGDSVHRLCATGWALCVTNTAGADCEMKLPRDEVYIAGATTGQPQGAPWIAAKVVQTWTGLQNTYLRGIGGCGNGVGAISGPPSASPPAGFQWSMECWESGHAPQIPNVVECPFSQASDADFSGVRILSDKAGVLCCKQ